MGASFFHRRRVGAGPISVDTMKIANTPSFELYGIAPHLVVATSADLSHALELDQAHWVATSAPLETLSCEPTLKDLLDIDGDQRITCGNLREAIRWLLDVFQDHSGIDSSSTTLKLSDLNTEHPDGERILRAATKIRNRVAGDDTVEVELSEVRTVKAQIESTPVSEAGVVLPEATADNDLRAFLNDILATVGGGPHPSGTQGVTADKLEEFLAAADGYLAWERQGQIPTPGTPTEIMPLAEATTSAYSVLSSVRSKLDQFFAQCEAAALDERFVQRMGWQESELAALDFDDPAVIETVLVQAPVACANPNRLLDLEGPLNPGYSKQLQNLRTVVMKPVLKHDGTTLSSLQWQQIKTFFAAHQAWVDSRIGESVALLGIDKLKTYSGPEYGEAVRALIADSARTAIMLDGIRLVEKAVLFQKNMIDLVNNFVSFPHLYDTMRRAMFEMGTLVMDGRRFNMAVRVTDRKQHTAVATTSGMFTLYAELQGPPGAKPIEVALPVTSGSKGNLCVGKRGIFFDVKGNEYNARIVQIIDNPISFAEALSAPFKKIGKMLTGKIEAWTSEADKKFESQTSTALADVQASTQTPAAPVAAPAPQQKPGLSAAGGMVMGTGVALAALGSAAAYITKTISEISWTGLILGVVGALLVVMLPLSIVAFIKLQRRDLSAILEGSGWAINARMRLTLRQGRFFTQRPAYPKGSKGVKRLLLRRVLWSILVILLIAFLAQQGHRLAQRQKTRRQLTPPSAETSVEATGTGSG